VRKEDIVSRLGGDEFVVLVREIANNHQAANLAQKIIDAISEPVYLQGREYRVTASVGIAMYPEDGEDEQTLMKNADVAMYLAKEEGKNNFQFYSANLRTLSLEKLTLENDLRNALINKQLFLEYQAKMNIGDSTISGVEALIRWNHPQLGLIAPDQFIPLAEESGIIIPIGRWVLETACRQAKAWIDQGLPPVCMAVNLSPRQFSDPNLLVDVSEVLRKTQLKPQLLELEITESMVMNNADRAVTLLKSIKSLGVRLAIDDFGTGYSSLGQLKQFPIDTIKVDKSFIRHIPLDAEDRAITEAIIAMGKSLSLTVVAEGVENLEQQRFLAEHACDQMQGFYFSKPISANDFSEFVKSKRTK
jgi:EAL domain-containing protein (putative c-di-GMP-specific phosphodiesterase class I)